MSRHTESRAASRQRGSTLLGLFLGLLLGVLVALGVAWYINRAPIPFVDKKPEAAPGAGKAAKPAAPAAQGNEPAPLPGKPGDKPLEKPRFDFYKVLPEGEQAALPTSATTPGGDIAPRPTVSEKVYLQVGSFQKPSEADNLRAKLALMGLEATVRQAEVPEKGVVHRVLVGPYATPDEFNAARNQLSQAGIPSSVVRNKN